MIAQSSLATPDHSRRILYETIVVILLTTIPALVFPELKGIVAIVPIAYLLIEARVRHRSWAELGFKPQQFAMSLRRNWVWVVVVGIVLPLLVTLAAHTLSPAFLEHILSRVPLLDTLDWLSFLFALAFATLLEELTYRALFQERLSWFIGQPMAIMMVAILFGLMHVARGDPMIVAVDVGLVILDGLIYGLIFARGKNILVSWSAHFLADAVAIVLLLFLV